MLDTKTNEFIAGFSLDYQNVNKYRPNSISGIRNFNRIVNERNLFEIFFKPKLKILLDKSQLASYKPELERVENGHPSGIKRKWLRIKIKNTGSVTAINCKVKLDILDGDSPIRPSDTKRLIWDDFSSTMNIYPKDTGEFCHVVFSNTNFPEFIAATISSEQAEKNPESTRQNGLGTGKYKIQITVTAENQASTSKTFNLVIKNNDFDLEEIHVP